MTKRSIVSITIISTLMAGCSTSSPNDTSVSSASSVSSIEETATYNNISNEELGIQFTYPSSWGEWIINPSPSHSDTQSGAIIEMTFSNHEKDMKDLEKQNKEVRFVFRKYDSDEYRYEEACDTERSIELCDVTKQQDILLEKERFTEQATQSIDGTAASITEFYDIPSGYLAKRAQFYTANQRVEFVAVYDIGNFLFSLGPNDQSLYDTAQKLLGTELNDPINTLYKMHPEELQNMKDFFTEVDQVIDSMKIDT